MTSASTYSEADTAPDAPAATYRLPRRQPPLASKCRLHGKQPQSVCVIATQTALEQIAAHSKGDLQQEVGGALLGQAYEHGERLYVEVKAALPAKSPSQGPVHFRFSADSWTELQQLRTEHYPQLDIVGWFHTHPNLGVFYSSDDVVVHSAAFTLPWHVGLVLDPIRREGAFFGWANSELTALNGFYELRDEQAESVVDWQVVVTTVFHEPDLLAETAVSPPPSQYTRRQPKPRSTSIATGSVGLALGVSGLLLSLLMLVGLVIPLQRQVDRLETVALTLADATLATSNGATCPDSRLRLLTPLSGSRTHVGETVSFMGSANHPDATRYRVEVRAAGAENWMLLDTQRRATSLGKLATWDTAPHAPGRYDVRLTAVDANNVRLVQTELCQISLELMP